MEEEPESQTFNEVFGTIAILGWVGVCTLMPLLFMISVVISIVFGIGYVYDKAVNYDQ